MAPLFVKQRGDGGEFMMLQGINAMSFTKHGRTEMNQGKCIIRKIIFLQGLILFLTAISCSRQSPVAPILVLATENEFGTYAGELLRAEGFNEYDIISFADNKLTESYLGHYDIILLALTDIDKDLTESLKNYVLEGGNLIAIRPDTSLSGLFGITPVGGKITAGYIGIDTSSAEGRGLSAQFLQLHTDADKYSLDGAKEIAHLLSDTMVVSKYPALVSFKYGRGHTYAFTFNLNENIVYTRQGNPSFAGLEKDGINGLRAMDLFTDGWLDPSKNTLNQADLQMNLLSHCIEYLTGFRKPLPRLWYFPDTLKSLITLTNDGEYRSETDFETQFADIDSAGAAMTLYVMETNKVSRDWTDKWSSEGFEISGHPDDTREAGKPVWSNMDSILALKKKEIADLYGLEMKTIVNHWFVWCGTDSSGMPEFAAQAAIEAKHGLGMDVNYAHYDNGSNQDHFLGEQGYNQGNFTGSGLIMKFATSKGKILDIYQHLNNVYDQLYNENQDPEGFFNCFKGLLDRSLNDQAYSFISIKSHNDEYYFSKEPLLKMIDYAGSKGIPVWTAEKLNDFVRMRDEAGFSDICWKNSRLSFLINSSKEHSSDLSVMIPYSHNNLIINEISLNGKKTDYVVRIIKGIQYVFILIQPNAIHSITAQYSSTKYPVTSNQ